MISAGLSMRTIFTTILVAMFVISSCALDGGTFTDVLQTQPTSPPATSPKLKIPIMLPTATTTTLPISDTFSELVDGVSDELELAVDDLRPPDSKTESSEILPEGDTSSDIADVVDLVSATLASLQMSAEHDSGYEREYFKHWVDADGDGCDTRKEVLLAEALQMPSVGASCGLDDGYWISRYDELIEEGSGSGFDVDHLVPLKEAWESGAHDWTAEMRELYANDLAHENALIAVSASSNRSKGARDPHTWLPPDIAQHCWYAAAWIEVKAIWNLTVDSAEKATLEVILASCSLDDFSH